jgi:hypothetical protein
VLSASGRSHTPAAERGKATSYLGLNLIQSVIFKVVSSNRTCPKSDINKRALKLRFFESASPCP